LPLSDIVVAARSQAQEVAESDLPSETWPSFAFKPLDSVTLATLGSLLATGEAQEAFQRFLGEVEMVACASEEGPWVSVLSEALVALLTTLADAPARLTEVAQSWALTEELSGWEPADLEEGLKTLAEHAALAQSKGAALFLWNAL